MVKACLALTIVAYRRRVHRWAVRERPLFLLGYIKSLSITFKPTYQLFLQKFIVYFLAIVLRQRRH